MAYLSLSTANLPDPAIDPAAGKSPSDYFGTLLWSGDDNATRTIQAGGSGVTGDINFTPDFAWIKRRNGATNGSDHMLLDSVRGVGSFNALSSNGSQAEGLTAAGSSWTNFGDIDAFTTDGFTVQKGSDPSHTLEGINESGGTYVGWNWKAGGLSNTYNIDGIGYASMTAAGLSDGSIATTGLSVNRTSGFSITRYTGSSSGTSIAHGLGEVPDFILVKALDRSAQWSVWHNALNANQMLELSTTGGVQTDNIFWNNQLPTSSYFYVPATGANGMNANGEDMIAYCFHSVEGFSKFGTYDDAVTGSDYENTSPFVYTGFRPAFVMIKGTTSGREWVMYDNKRTPDNGVYLRANTSAAEQTDATNHDISFNANGFKIRGGSGDINTTNESYIYMAFADQPFKFANGGTE